MTGAAGARPITKVLIANRGEIAVRVIRACRDEEIATVACYADGDLGAPFTRMADEAVSLGGVTAAQTYLCVDKLIGVGVAAGADAVHPGYGFLSESAELADAVIGAGMTWIGPTPAAIRELGDKVSARRLARRVGAPLAAGSDGPVGGAGEVEAFAAEHGLPVAIKAVHGGGGRGLKVARTLGEIPECYAAAVREATAAFGRGECFVERYLSPARHVEAQVLADRHGAVAVLGTRDCTLQRRHQKLVEEAPAPFLSGDQHRVVTESAAAICRAGAYHGAATVEYLLGGDGTVSFLEVNTRLQVEHPVTEETTGVDIVRQQLRIAAGEHLDPGDVAGRGHSIEFRINCEDPTRGFLPSPGTVARLVLPQGPGVRVDTGVEEGSVVGAQFDSLLVKVIVTGSDRRQALRRARRVLDEMVLDGMPTTLGFHRSVVRDPAFVGDDTGFGVHTGWIEEQWQGRTDTAPAELSGPASGGVPARVVVDVGGRPLEVSLPGLAAVHGEAGVRLAARVRERRTRRGPDVSGDEVRSPMQGTLVRLAVTEGAPVVAGVLVAVVEAMKMENAVTAHKSGTVTAVSVQAGQAVRPDDVLCRIVS